MHKSSVYLPEELKAALAARAASSGHSEADLLRRAIEALLATTEPAETGPARPEVQLDPTRPQLVGVGTGPGDPNLLTRHAEAVLGLADRVITISADAHSVGRAEAVVRAVAPLASVHRVAFRIGRDEDRAASMDELVDAALAGLDANELVAVAVLGDPSQWTVFPELAARVRSLRPGTTVTATPGVTGYQAAAARAVTNLGDSRTTLVVTSDLARARDAMAQGCSVVVHKAVTDGASVRRLAGDSGRTDALVAELTGTPGERLLPVDRVPDGPLAYLSCLLAPAPRRSPGRARAAHSTTSHRRR